MCGLAGFVQRGGFSESHGRRIASKMGAMITHRGPDDGDVWLDPRAGVALANRRLAVVDLSAAGHQPMCSHSGRYVISFNGEIYNHRELRLQVDVDRVSAVRWRGASDTESLLAAIEHFGLKHALRRAIGMFTFAVWDRQERVLYLARDRLGEKPLYLGWQSGVFMFASELKSLTCHPAFEGLVDREALALYLRHNYIPSPWSIYQGIRKLAPGTFVKIGFGDKSPPVGAVTEPESYWSLREVIDAGREHPFEGDAGDAVDALHGALRESVESQIEADVPLGAFLSGGIDSSTVVALMQACSSRPVRTFTIGFEERAYNEAEHAKEVANHLGVSHTEMYVSAHDALDVIPRLPILYDEPFSDPSQIPTFMVAAMTREHVTVALSGDGGDELFGGYTQYFRTRTLWRYLAPVPSWMRRAYQQAIGITPPLWGRSRAFDRACKLSEILDFREPEELYHRLQSRWNAPAAIVRHSSEPQTCMSNRRAWPDAAELESRMMAIDALMYLPDDILVKVDRAAMGVSLETRAPFLDHRVVELAWRLPLAVKIRGNEGKWILRQVLYRHVPARLVERPKMGFSVPLAAWLRGPLKDWAESLLDEGKLREEGYFHPAPIRKRWTEHLDGARRWDACIWDVLMFQAWLDESRGTERASALCRDD